MQMQPACEIPRAVICLASFSAFSKAACGSAPLAHVPLLSEVIQWAEGLALSGVQKFTDIPELPQKPEPLSHFLLWGRLVLPP